VPFFGKYKKKQNEELNDNYKVLKDSRYPSILTTLQGSLKFGPISKMGKYAENRNGIFFFLFSSKMAFTTLGSRMLIFPHLSLPTKAAPDIGVIGLNPSKLKLLFQNEWDFWPFFAPLVLKD
jgi:hypothetical protein